MRISHPRPEDLGFEALIGAVKHGKQYEDVKKMITWSIEYVAR